MSFGNQQGQMPSVELLLDYLDGILTDEAKEKIDQEMAGSEELTSIVEGLKIYYKSIDFNREKMDDYIQSLSIGFAEKRNQVKKKPPKTGFYIRIAATFLLVAAFATLLILNRDRPNDLLTLVDVELSKHYAVPGTSRSEGEELAQLWSQVTLAYGARNFASAINPLRLIDEADENDPTSWFYLGLCYAYKSTPDFEQSIDYLKRVTETSHAFSDRAKWYLALIYIKQNRQAEAQKLVQEIKEKGGFKSKEAERIFSSMNL